MTQQPTYEVYIDGLLRGEVFHDFATAAAFAERHGKPGSTIRIALEHSWVVPQPRRACRCGECQ